MEHSFTVASGIDETWRLLRDSDRIGSCIPGASFDWADGDDVTGTLKVEVGADVLTYRGGAELVAVDATTYRAVFEVHGYETSGGGTAAGTVTTVLDAQDAGTLVTIGTDLRVISGPSLLDRDAQVEAGAALIGRFAGNLTDLVALATGADGSVPPGDAEAVDEPEPAGEPAGGSAGGSDSAETAAAPAKKTSKAAAKAPAKTPAKAATKAPARKRTTRPKPTATPAEPAAEPAEQVSEPAEPAPADSTPADSTPTDSAPPAEPTPQPLVAESAPEPEPAAESEPAGPIERAAAEAAAEAVAVAVAEAEAEAIAEAEAVAVAEAEAAADEVIAAVTASAASSATSPPTSGANGHQVTPPRPVHEVGPIDVVEPAGPSIARRFAPALVALIVALIVLRRRRRAR